MGWQQGGGYDEDDSERRPPVGFLRDSRCESASGSASFWRSARGAETTQRLAVMDRWRELPVAGLAGDIVLPKTSSTLTYDGPQHT